MTLSKPIFMLGFDEWQQGALAKVAESRARRNRQQNKAPPPPGQLQPQAPKVPSIKISKTLN